MMRDLMRERVPHLPLDVLPARLALFFDVSLEKRNAVVHHEAVSAASLLERHAFIETQEAPFRSPGGPVVNDDVYVLKLIFKGLRQ